MCITVNHEFIFCLSDFGEYLFMGMDDELNIEAEEEFYVSRDMYLCCIGAIDGSHIKIEVPNEDKPHGIIEEIFLRILWQYVLSMWNLFYVTAGWGRLAADST